jgi:hypothetical protein
MYLSLLISQTRKKKGSITSPLMTKRRKQPMSDTVKTVRYQLSISQNTENLAVATLHQQREIKD